MKRRLVLVVILTMIFGACGGSDGDTAGDTDATEAPVAVSGDVAHGIEIYNGTCVACHGPEGIGVEGLGKPWVGSEFINARTDDEMLAFLIEGRASDHPENTTGIAMMPRGGNASLTDADLLDLIAYMRTLNLGS
jgi:mono/diheme cytochrome c family protein